MDLHLKDHDRVVLTIERVEGAARTTTQAEAVLLAGGLLRTNVTDASAMAGVDPSNLAMTDLDRRIPLPIQGKPLSVTVVEERGEGW
jgi:hypothetical protein